MDKEMQVVGKSRDEISYPCAHFSYVWWVSGRNPMKIDSDSLNSNPLKTIL